MKVITKEEFEFQKTCGDICGSVSELFETNKETKGLWHHYFNSKTKKFLGIVVYNSSKDNIDFCLNEAEKSKKLFEDKKSYKKEKAKSESQLKKEILNCKNVEEIIKILKGTNKESAIGCSSIKSGKYGNYIDFYNIYGTKNVVLNF